MATFSLRRFARPDVLRSIDPGHLLAILEPHRAYFTGRDVNLPEPAGVAPPALDYDALVRVLATPRSDTPAALTDALYFVDGMATADGMAALLDAAGPAALGIPPGFPGWSAADVAARAWVRCPGVLERKHAELAAARVRRFVHFRACAGLGGPFAAPADQGLTELAAALDDTFERRARGRSARVFAYQHAAECLFVVRHGDLLCRQGTLDGDQQSSVLYRPLKFDVVVYRPAAGTLRVHAGSPWEAELYRDRFGRALSGGADYFARDASYTLEPLRAGDPACLSCADDRHLKAVTLTAVHLARGGAYEEVEVRRATDVLAAHRRAGGGPLLAAGRGRVVRAEFALQFRGCRDVRALVVEPPNVAHYGRDEDCGLVEGWLSARGFARRPEPEGTDDGDAAGRQLLLAGA